MSSPTAATAATAAAMLANRDSRGVRPDQRVRIVDQSLDEGLLHDSGCLADDQQHERDRIERQLQERRHERDAAERASEVEAGGDESLTMTEPVDGRADERCQHGQRHHRHQQVQQHLFPRGVGADVEEQRTRQAHGDERIGRGRPDRGRCSTAPAGRRRPLLRRVAATIGRDRPRHRSRPLLGPTSTPIMAYGGRERVPAPGACRSAATASPAPAG